MLDTVVLWLQRDLRLHDNPALASALLSARNVVITFVWAPEEEGQFQPGRASRWWLYNSLQALEKQILGKCSYICYRRGHRVADQLLEVCKLCGASFVYFNNVYDPLSLVRDHALKRHLLENGILARSFNAEVLYEPWEIVDDHGRPFTDFASFWHKSTTGMAKPPPSPVFSEPVVLPTVDHPALRQFSLDDLGIQTPAELRENTHWAHTWSPGTAGALKLFLHFLSFGLPTFDHDRAKIDRGSTSKLSPHIHFGEISRPACSCNGAGSVQIRVVVHEVRQREERLEKQRPGSTAVRDFLQQLGYREYSRYLSFHFPFTHERSLLEHVRAVPWVHCSQRFRAWRQGATGYPIIDAAMRELWSTGWMHNRARIFTASFMVKNLLLPWQWGLKHFWDMLLDADLECDALGWQYAAGCLQDAHPFNYMLNVETESRRFDPNGDFIRRWLPSLQKMPLEYIHRPWDAPPHVLDAAGVKLGEDYPLPLVTISESRAALDRAYGVIQKCITVKGTHQEPYRRPTFPVEMKLLEPEEEVEQVPVGSQARRVESGLDAKGGAARPPVCFATTPAVLRPSLHGTLANAPPGCTSVPQAALLRHEQYPPGNVLPDISRLCASGEQRDAIAPAPTHASSHNSCGYSHRSALGSTDVAMQSTHWQQRPPSLAAQPAGKSMAETSSPTVSASQTAHSIRALSSQGPPARILMAPSHVPAPLGARVPCKGDVGRAPLSAGPVAASSLRTSDQTNDCSSVFVVSQWGSAARSNAEPVCPGGSTSGVGEGSRVDFGIAASAKRGVGEPHVTPGIKRRCPPERPNAAGVGSGADP